MISFDKLAEANRPGSSEFNKEDWKQKKAEQREAVYGMMDAAVQKLQSGATPLDAYLDVQARFLNYSVANGLLILEQMPAATRLRDYDGWRDAGKQVKKGAKGIYILTQGREFTKDDGSIGYAYDPKQYFDVTQTGGRAEESREQQSFPERAVLSSLVSRSPVPVRATGQLPDGVDARYDKGKNEILAAPGQTTAATIYAVARELAAAVLGSNDISDNLEFKSDCAAQLFCRRYGVKTRTVALPDSMREAQAKEFRAALGEAKDTAEGIGRMVYRELSASAREQKEPANEAR